MKSVQIEIFNGLPKLPDMLPGRMYAMRGIRSGLMDSIQSVSRLAIGKPEEYPIDQRGNFVFVYETKKNPEIERALSGSLEDREIDMYSLMGKLPHPPSTDDSLTKYFIVIPNRSKTPELPSAHYSNEIVAITTNMLDRNPLYDIFDRSYIVGAHMAGHLLLSEFANDDGHCKRLTCCMHPHMSGLKDIDEIIEARTKEKRKGLFCRDSLKQFEEYMESLKINQTCKY